ncbi:GH32 C-terminal domain-containing protein [Kitasatospora sp. NPDC004799]|uniref:GH32 C-terminal domain-containing protein n=1 Tax=Kitasatospora sp. NPDC004799 TaxID=3154460 RepID=UPI0033A46ED0
MPVPPAPVPRARRPLAALAATALAALTVLPLTPASAATDRRTTADHRTATDHRTAYQEPYRPQFHFSPARNWMNDPNGPIHHRGAYHLFFQYNPAGATWGNMSWGHATSPDLVHWTEQPLAIPQDDTSMIFSGAVVDDRTNSSGLGTADDPPLVAVYTSAARAPGGRQTQSLAYSLDGGTSWTKYQGNPVLDIGSADFRDPKVFWNDRTGGWLMAVALADRHQIRFYSSHDLKSWTRLSEFGPAGATGGVWECPDLFPLAVDGDPARTRWVLTVSTNGGPQRSTAVQYFIGDFDGTAFTADDPAGGYTPPAGTLLNGFDDGGYRGWTATGTAFGAAPATGTLPGQQPVSGFTGPGLANTFLGGDAATGELLSPPFTVTRRHLNFLVGGGNHPYVPGAGDGSAPPGTTLADFRGPALPSGWTAVGGLAGIAPTEEQLDGGLDGGVLDTFTPAAGDAATGTVTSPEFTVDRRYLNALIGGGNHPAGTDGETTVNLVVDGRVVRSATGRDSGELNWTSWDVGEFAGRRATVRIVDGATGGWGHLMVDHLQLSDQQARPRDRQTAVNLLVDGRVVRSATGGDGETLDWTSWDLADLIGRQARIQVVDHATGGWGHVLADQFTLADAPALGAAQRAHWLDHGADFYAATSVNDEPHGRRVVIGWMNNWAYADKVPTSPWRGVDGFPRELALTADAAGRTVLVQRPVRELAELREGRPWRTTDLPVRDTRLPLPVSGAALEIDARLRAGTAREFGLAVRTGGGHRTRIGYDTATGELYVDRTASGNTGFHESFAAVHRAKLPLDPQGRLDLRVLVDASSVEVYAGGGRLVLTDQVFPDPSDTGLALYADGGTARADSLTARQLRSSWRS